MHPKALPFFIQRIYLFINRLQSYIFAKQQSIVDLTWLGKGKNRTARLLLLALFWYGSHHVAPKWDYMCMKQEVEHSPTIHQSLGGPVWKFVHVYSAGTLTVLMHVHVLGSDKVRGCTVWVCVCSCILWGLKRRANGASTVQPLHHPARQAHARWHAWEGFNILCVWVCLCACAAVFTQGMQFIIFVCVSGYYIYSLHTCVQRQMEPEG